MTANPNATMVGTMLIILPSVYSGGMIQVLDGKKKIAQEEQGQQVQVERSHAVCSYDFSSFNSYECAYAFHYGSNSQFALQPLLTGSRLILVYQVLQTNMTIPQTIYHDTRHVYQELVASHPDRQHFE